MAAANAIRILTYHHVANHGAVLQAYSLSEALSREFRGYDVKILDYIPRVIKQREFLKIFKPCRKIPFFYSQRYFMFRKFVKANLPLDRKLPGNKSLERLIAFINSQNYDALIVGSDKIWGISQAKSSPSFPNIYWLSDSIATKKIAYAVSAYGSDPHLVNKYQGAIQRRLNSFDVIGVRDEFTLDLVESCEIDTAIPVLKVPDPTFLYEIRQTNAEQLLSDMGIDLHRPILGILIYGKTALSERIRAYFKSKGYQILALSMYNPCADFNSGHILNPFEWAEVFKYLTFCITDRFHGTIFCLKNKTPFISIEPWPLNSISQSKIYSLLSDFGIPDCYANVDKNDFNADDFLGKCTKLLNCRERYEMLIDKGLETMKKRSCDYIKKIKKVITNA